MDFLLEDDQLDASAHAGTRPATPQNRTNESVSQVVAMA